MLDAGQWYAAVADAKLAGFTWFELLTAYDDLGRSDQLIVVLRLRDAAGRDATELTVGLDREAAELPDISDLFGGASWGQRYVHDFYGVTFTGADLRPLLNHDGGAPLRKDVILGARAVTPFPAADQRRGTVAGVPDPAVWGDRDPALPPATPQELLAQSSRRRRR